MEDFRENDRSEQAENLPNDLAESETPSPEEEYEYIEDELGDEEEEEEEEPAARGSGKGSFIALVAMVCFFCSLLAGAFGMFIGMRLGGTSLTFDAMIRRLRANTEDSVAEHTIAEVCAAATETVVTVQVSVDNETVAKISSGVIVAQESGYAYIVAALHGIEGYPHIRVKTASDDTYLATCVGTDWTTDLALLRIEATGLRVAAPSASSAIMGETVVAIGNPMGGLGNCASFGIVSSPSVNIAVMGIPTDLIKLDAALNQGNSGGGVFNMDGELIGIVSSKISEYGGVQAEGLAFALPVSTVYGVIDQIRRQGSVSGRPDLGLTFSSPASPTSPLTVEAYEYGEELAAGDAILPGDILLRAATPSGAVKELTVSATGRSYHEAQTALRSLLYGMKEGDTLYLIVKREGYNNPITVTVKVHTK